MTEQVTDHTRRLRIVLGSIADDLAWRAPTGSTVHGATLTLTLSGCLLALGLGQLFPVSQTPEALVLLSVILVQPMLEELIFRGFLLSCLLRYAHTTTGRLAAIAVQAFAFSLLHVVHHPPEWAALIVLPGLIFGWLRVRHDSVLPAIAMHSAYNGAYCLPGILW